MALTQVENRYLDMLTEREFPTLPPAESAQVMGDEQDAMPADAPIQLAMGSRGYRPGVSSDRPISDVALGLGDMLAGALRGTVAQATGLPGDVEMLVRGLRSVFTAPEDQSKLEAFARGLEQKTFLPTTERMNEVLPPVVPPGARDAASRQQTADVANTLGEFNPLSPALVKPAIRGVKKAGEALAPKAGEMAEGFLQRQGLMPGVVEDAPRLIQERVPGVQPGEELIVQHNLTASNLVKADRLGGLPVPSLAISRAANPMDNFGEITLIAPKEFANPSAKNPVFRADAYTARFPTIDFEIDQKSANNLQKFMGDVIEAMPEGQRKFGRLVEDWRNRQYSDLLRAKFLQERGELPDPSQFDNQYLFQAAVNKQIDNLSSEFSDWNAGLDDRLKDAGVNIKERIFKGFTYSGNRRYAAATLDNIVKEMKGGAGDEGFNYGVGNLRAVATPRFRTLAQVKAARGKLVDGKKMDEIKQQAQDAYVDILERMRGVNERYSAEDALLEFAESKRISTLDRIYDGKMPDELKADIGIFLQKIQELPTEYFELKPQRAVTLDEFRGAIIPKNTPQAARDVLNKAGITEVYEYSTPEERKALFQRYGKEMFTAAPAGTGIGAATMQEQENE
jgi:hypothetical protein